MQVEISKLDHTIFEDQISISAPNFILTIRVQTQIYLCLYSLSIGAGTPRTPASIFFSLKFELSTNGATSLAY